jgi:predicted nucleotidyltransferase
MLLAMGALVCPPAVERALQRFGDALRSQFGARLVDFVLFGSYARGDAHEDSDVDVLVAIDDLSEGEWRRVLDLAYMMGRAQDETVGLSPLVYSSAQAKAMRAGGRRLFRDIDGEGVRL